MRTTRGRTPGLTPTEALYLALGEWAMKTHGADVERAFTFAEFALAQARGSGLSLAKVLCRLDHFADAEWRDFCQQGE